MSSGVAAAAAGQGGKEGGREGGREGLVSIDDDVISLLPSIYTPVAHASRAGGGDEDKGGGGGGEGY